jgi:hypothetical protein
MKLKNLKKLISRFAHTNFFKFFSFNPIKLKNLKKLKNIFLTGFNKEI